MSLKRVRLNAWAVTDEITAKALREAEQLAGFRFPVTQGSYRTSVSASAGTHSGPAALDFSTRGLTAKQKTTMVRCLRIVGFAAWLRPYRPRVWGEHVHAIRCGAVGLPRQAASQVAAYRAGRDGLSGNRLDPHRDLKIKPTTWEAYLKAAKPVPVISLAAVNNAYKLDPPKPVGVKTTPRGTAIVEQALHAEGLLARTLVDGHFGSSTINALKAFQARHGLKPTGIPNKTTLDLLGRRRGFKVAA